MIIFITGTIGAGKTTISNELSKRLWIYNYEIDELKREIRTKHPDYGHILENHLPFPDDLIQKSYKIAIKHFAKLSKEHKHIIVCETLYKKDNRKILFDWADKYFNWHIIIRLDVDKEVIKKRLNTERKWHLLKDPYGRFLALKDTFDTFDKIDLRIKNNWEIDNVANEIIYFIKKNYEFK